jgi:phosphomannomutase
MLTRTWETAAEELVNSDVDGFIAKLAQFIKEKNITPLQKKPLVVVGSDCRDHSPILSSLVKKGVEAVLSGICIDVGNVTTPLLHYVVASVNNDNNFNATDFNREKFFNLYFQELLSGFSDLVATTDGKSGSYKAKVVLDTAYGVGSVTTTQFLDYAGAKGLDNWEIEIRNKVGEGLLQVLPLIVTIVNYCVLSMEMPIVLSSMRSSHLTLLLGCCSMATVLPR